ncbi:hypothetical protein QEP73_15130 [Pseudomonas defluvii]|nr:hypothetical protein QEP73_15130 [Pseudomonas defluvii]
MPTENRSSNTDMVSVPREPTDEMLVAGQEAWATRPRGALEDCEEAAHIWAAMVDLAPAQADKSHMKAPELTDDLREILGRPNFKCHFIAKALRVMGHTITHKSEDEQAAVIHWLLGLYLKYGSDWRQHASAELEQASKSLKS